MNQRKKGIILSYVYMVVTIVVTFLYTPFLISNLGKSEYGLYTLSYSIMAYLSLLDLGLGNAMVRYVAKYKTLKDKKSESQINGMFLIMYLFIAILTVIIGLILLANVTNIFGKSLTLEELKTAKILLAILIVNVSISFPLSIFGSYVIASEKFFFQKTLLILKTILMPIIMIPLLLNGFKSIALVIVLTILTLLLNLSNLFLSVFKLNMKIEISPKCFSFLKEIFGYSFFIFLAMIVDSIFNNTDQVLLGIYCGTAAVSIYAVSSQIRSLYEQLSTSISGVFLPKIVSMKESGKSKKQISDFFISISRIQMMILILILMGFIIFGRQFITLWTDQTFMDAYYIALIVIIPSTIPLTQNIAISVIQAENKHQFRSVVYFIIAILNILLSIPLINLYSGIGAALGTSVALLLGQILVMNIYYYKKINLDIPKYWKTLISLLLPITIYSVISFFIVDYLNINSWLMLLLSALVYTLGYFIIIYMLFMNNSEKNYVKKVLKVFKKIIYKLYPKFLVRKIILLESSPDMTDNTYEIYEYMLNEKVNNKYKLVWCVTDKKKFKDINIKNVKFIDFYPNKNIFKLIKKVYYNYSAKIIIDSNNFIYKKNKHQIRFHLFHGMGFKNVPEYTNYCGESDYFATLSDTFHPMLVSEFKNTLDKFVSIGFARNDMLVNKSTKNIKKIFNLPDDSKVIVWLPTYRNHKNKDSAYHLENVNEIGIPIINNKEEIIKLNKTLVENNVFILLKLHPAEDLSTLKAVSASNLILISNQDLNDKNITLYELLSKSDSLITDYSSVYFDYLLTGNMIGLTFNDLEQYIKTNGFTCPDYEKAVYGEKIYNYNDFEKYIINVSKNKYDKKMYNKYINMYHTYSDGKSTERLYKIIKKHL